MFTCEVALGRSGVGVVNIYGREERLLVEQETNDRQENHAWDG